MKKGVLVGAAIGGALIAVLLVMRFLGDDDSHGGGHGPRGHGDGGGEAGGRQHEPADAGCLAAQQPGPLPIGVCRHGAGAGRRGLTHNDMPRNGLAVAALGQNGPLLQFLKAHRLGSTALAGLPAPMLANLAGNTQYAADLLRYVISCALDPDDDVSVAASPSPAPPLSFGGELGLCGKTSPYGDWSSASPTGACLEVVSACVFARTNALDKRVLISVRGEPDCLFPLQVKVPVETELRNHTRIGSFAPGVAPDGGVACPAATPAGDPKRSCGWEPRSVGVCTPGTTVKLTPSSPRAMVRICAGLYGCDDSATPWTGGEYHGFLASSAPGAAVSFMCPGSTTRPAGYFSVMMALSDPTLGALHPGDDVALSPPPPTPPAIPAYPATEAQVFTWREGGFYGDLFRDPTRCPLGKSLDAGAFSSEEYACYSDIWTAPQAYMADRLCAGHVGGTCPDLDPCFTNNPLPCTDAGAAPGCPVDGGPECAPTTSAAAVYQTCHGLPPHVYRGVTVFLNDPCDVADPDLNDKDLRACSTRQ